MVDHIRCLHRCDVRHSILLCDGHYNRFNLITMNATDNFWDTGVHPITGYVIKSVFGKNTQQNVKRNASKKHKPEPIWGTK